MKSALTPTCSIWRTRATPRSREAAQDAAKGNHQLAQKAQYLQRALAAGHHRLAHILGHADQHGQFGRHGQRFIVAPLDRRDQTLGILAGALNGCGQVTREAEHRPRPHRIDQVEPGDVDDAGRLDPAQILVQRGHARHHQRAGQHQSRRAIGLIFKGELSGRGHGLRR
jgi:hypothetical protein